MPSTKTSAVVELLVTLDRTDGEPLHRQLERHLRDKIRDGSLAGGAIMPSSRSLAVQLGVARGVVVETYEQLLAEGYLLSTPGGSTRVAELPGVEPRARSTSPAAPDWIELRPGRPDVTEFPRTAWGRAMRRVLAEAPADRLTYHDGTAMPELRRALAGYLGRARGTSVHPDDVVVTTGFLQALHLIAIALHAAGRRSIAVEEPYDPAYRAALVSHGLEVVPVPVDADGLDTDALRQASVDAVVVTPAHQFPTGSVMTAARRTDLLAWAREQDAVVVEDDYDAEFRYDRDPVGSLQGLDPEHVIYAGTASKSVAPGLRLGWLLSSPDTAAALVAAKLALDHGSGALDQLAFASFIEHGDLDRHLRYMRRHYRRRRDALLAALDSRLTDWRVVGVSAGLHVLALLPPGLSEERVLAAARDAGVHLYGAGRYRATRSGHAGIVFGYGAADEAAISRAITSLAEGIGDDVT